MPVSDPREFERVRREIARLKAMNDVVIRVLTVEQARLAQIVVREAGRK